MLDGVDFIPSDFTLRREAGEAAGGSNDGRLQFVTGPNAGGKSTFLRTLGALCVLSQVRQGRGGAAAPSLPPSLGTRRTQSAAPLWRRSAATCPRSRRSCPW